MSIFYYTFGCFLPNRVNRKKKSGVEKINKKIFFSIHHYFSFFILFYFPLNLLLLMAVAAEGVYAVVIVCVFILFVLVSCIGMRMLRKSRHRTRLMQQQSSSSMEPSWQQQPTSSVNVLMESVDNHTLESTTCKNEEIVL
jgi:hypothetical protein